VAVGASSISVLRLVLGRMVAIIVSGAAVGSLLALAAGRTLASVVYQTSPRDPPVFFAVGAILVIAGVASCWAPARRSLVVEPMIALRPESIQLENRRTNVGRPFQGRRTLVASLKGSPYRRFNSFGTV